MAGPSPSPAGYARVPTSPRHAVTGLVVWLAISFAAAGLGSLLTAPSLEGWYSQLNKPFFNPPNWVFGPVWTLLFAMMGTAAWMVWLRPAGPARSAALRLFLVQLVCNVAWSWLFFTVHSPGAALVEILVLLAAIGATARAFARLHPPAGALLLPYAAWVAFAAVLNLAIWRLN